MEPSRQPPHEIARSIRVLVVDDHPIVRQGLVSILEDEPDMEIVGQASNGNIIMELEPGKYHWCTCGLSTNQPFCNGAHKGSGFVPLSFELMETKAGCALCL